MIRYLCLFLAFLCGCAPSKKEDDILRISVLRGPSVIAFAKLLEDSPQIDGKQISVDIVDSPEQMQAVLIKGEADLAALPMINAANLYNKGIKYTLSGCPVWGNLYIVGKKVDTDRTKDTRTLYIFAAGTTPDILTRHYLKEQGLSYDLNYSFATPREIAQGLLSGQIKKAVLAEPFLSTVLHKDSALQIESDLNNPDSSSPGFAQTAIVHSPSLKDQRKQIDSLLTESCQFAVRHPEKAIRILEEKKVFAPGSLTPESIRRCCIRYIPANEAQESIYRFLRLIETYEPKAIGGKLPDNAFLSDSL